MLYYFEYATTEYDYAIDSGRVFNTAIEIYNIDYRIIKFFDGDVRIYSPKMGWRNAIWKEIK